VFPVRYELNFYILFVRNRTSVENIRGLNLAVVKLTTVQVTKLPF
jgi:hypothetical protein